MRKIPILFNGERHKNMLFGFVIYAALSVLMLLYEIWDYKKLTEHTDLYDYFIEMETQLTLFLLFIGLFVITGIVFIIIYLAWFYRAYNNLAYRGLNDTSPGWAIGAWFIPLYWWFACFFMFKEIWNKKQMHRNPEQKEPLTFLAHLWWIAFIISNATNSISSMVSSFDESLSGYQNSAIIAIVSSVVAIISLVAGFVVHRRVGVFEAEFFEGDEIQTDIETHLIND